MSTERFWKGHGTGNDFVIIEDLADARPPSEQQVRFWCDRRFGIGADGLLRVAPAGESPAQFFMDYRNADGSLAEMCGNGLRVFARHLVNRGLVAGPDFDVLTRAGLRHVRVNEESITVSMGAVTIDRDPTQITHGSTSYWARGVDVGNPHAVVSLSSHEEITQLDLTTAPSFDQQRFPAGVNVEFCYSNQPGEVEMRVHERGVGETLSCGTGVVASAAVHASEHGHLGKVRVRVPGGELMVTFDPEQAYLTGPAVIVADGQLERFPDKLVPWLSSK